MRTLAIANLKGGVGKTTLSFNLACELSARGNRVLLIDADAQGCLTDSLRLQERPRMTLAEVLRGQATAATAAVPTRIDGLFAIAASPQLDDINSRNLAGEDVLRARRATNFDYTVIDCPGHAGVVLLNALIAADDVLCPVMASGMATQGVRRLLDIIGEIRNRGAKPGLDLSGIVVSQHDIRTRIAGAVIARLRSEYGPLVLDNMLRRSPRFAESTDSGVPVAIAANSSHAAYQLRSLTDEVVKLIAARSGYFGAPAGTTRPRLVIAPGGRPAS